MVNFLEAQGIRFRHCEGYSDYYDELPGGKARGRSIETDLFDTRQLGPWEARLRISETIPAIPLYTAEVAPATLGIRTVRAVATIAKIGRASRSGHAASPVGAGIGCGAAGLDVAGGRRRRHSGLELDAGDRLHSRGRPRRRCGCTAQRPRASDPSQATGCCSTPAASRTTRRCALKYGRQPSSTKWTVANPGDTGEVIESAIKHGAATDLMDEAWWIPTTVMPDGSPLYIVSERSKPHGDHGRRLRPTVLNEAASYMQVGQDDVRAERHRRAVPSWWVMDSHHRRRYMWGFFPGGVTPKKWLSSGYFEKADSIDGAGRANALSIPNALADTVHRFNANAARGVDPDFHKGERAYDRYYADPTRQTESLSGAGREAAVLCNRGLSRRRGYVRWSGHRRARQGHRRRVAVSMRACTRPATARHP